MELQQEMDRIVANKAKERHSLFQLHYFLIGKEPTVQAKMWRCIRELTARKETLRALNLEIDDVNDDLELINIEIDKFLEEDAVSQIKKRKLGRRKNELIYRLENLENRKSCLEEEISYLVKSYVSLEKIESLKDFDDLDAQKQYWNEKLSQEFNLRNLFGLPPDLELLKTVLALNGDAPVKQNALQMIENVKNMREQQAKMEEYQHLMQSAKSSSTIKMEPIKDGV